MTKSGILLAAAAAALALAGTAAWAADGATIYKDNCAKCHGATGAADTPAAQALKVPSLKGDANVKKMTAAEVAQRIKGNAKHPPPVKDMGAPDVEAAAAYVKTLVGE